MPPCRMHSVFFSSLFYPTNSSFMGLVGVSCNVSCCFISQFISIPEELSCCMFLITSKRTPKRTLFWTAVMPEGCPTILRALFCRRINPQDSRKKRPAPNSGKTFGPMSPVLGTFLFGSLSTVPGDGAGDP